MIVVIGHLKLKNLEELRRPIDAMVEASRGEAGCLHYAFAADLLDPDVVRISERWTDWDALKAHGAMPHMATWRAALKGATILEREVIAYEAGEPARSERKKSTSGDHWGRRLPRSPSWEESGDRIAAG